MHPVFLIRTFLTSLMKKKSFQKISNVLSFLILVQCFGATAGSTTIIPTPTLNVTSKTYSACYVPPSSCPLSDDDRDLHIACLFNLQGSCPPGWTYFCDKKSSMYLVEGCVERHVCPKGTANYIKFNPSSRTTEMKCKECKEHFIQRGEHDTAVDYLPGCDTLGVSLHILQNLDKMVQVFDGGTTDYSQYVCDTSKGYSEKRHITLCNVSNYCSCEQSVTCDNPQFPVLLPNGDCDKTCATDRDSSFRCILYEQHANSTDRQMDTTDAIAKTTKKNEQTTQGLSDRILAVIIGLISLAIICTCIYVLRVRKSKKLKRQHLEAAKQKELAELLKGQRENQTSNTKITNKYFVENLIKVKDATAVELNIPGKLKEVDQVNEDVAPENDGLKMDAFVIPLIVPDQVGNLPHETDEPLYCEMSL